MQIENIYPIHTTEEEWSSLAQLASRLLSTIAASLQERGESVTMSV